VIRAAAERDLLSRVGRERRYGAEFARAAVLLARTACPDADPDRVDGILESLGTELRRRGRGAETPEDRAALLAGILAGERGLRGNRERYDDPRNSCLECVLDRRLGIPLALSVLWMETARRAGWRVDGIGLPGHFVVRVRDDGEGGVLADPFHGGGVLTAGALKSMVRDLTGKPVLLADLDLDGLAPPDLLLRMLRNLRAAFRRRADRRAALAVAEDMLLLSPGLPEALRDRGMLRLDGGDRAGGIADLREFLDRAPKAPGAETVLRLVSIVTDGAELPN
jgi:regulator of sirC expression with transglutaminase-like and TPR domain